jgi:hypothetical protein
MQRIVVVAARGPLYRKLVVAAAMVAAGIALGRAEIAALGLPVGTIGWSEVTGASVRRIGSVPVVMLDLRDPERFMRRLPATRQFIARKALEAGLPAVYLTLAGTDADAERIAEAIRRRVS